MFSYQPNLFGVKVVIVAAHYKKHLSAIYSANEELTTNSYIKGRPSVSFYPEKMYMLLFVIRQSI